MKQEFILMTWKEYLQNMKCIEEWFWLFSTFSSIQLLKRRICHLWICRFSFIVFTRFCVCHRLCWWSLSWFSFTYSYSIVWFILSTRIVFDFCLIRKWIECKSVVVKFFLLNENSFVSIFNKMNSEQWHNNDLLNIN